jgi:hypothetical protein
MFPIKMKPQLQDLVDKSKKLEELTSSYEKILNSFSESDMEKIVGKYLTEMGWTFHQDYPYLIYVKNHYSVSYESYNLRFYGPYLEENILVDNVCLLVDLETFRSFLQDHFKVELQRDQNNLQNLQKQVKGYVDFEGSL